MNGDRSSSAGTESYRAALELQFSAIGELFDRHRRELLDYAKKRLRLQGIPDVEYSEDDVVQSSVRTFFEDWSRAKSIDSMMKSAL